MGIHEKDTQMSDMTTKVHLRRNFSSQAGTSYEREGED